MRGLKSITPKMLGNVYHWLMNFVYSVTCRGSGSSLTGGATPFQGGWVLDLSSLDNIEIDKPNRLARCSPGAVVSNLQEQVSQLWSLLSPGSIFQRLLHNRR